MNDSAEREVVEGGPCVLLGQPTENGLGPSEGCLGGPARSGPFTKGRPISFSSSIILERESKKTKMRVSGTSGSGVHSNQLEFFFDPLLKLVSQGPEEWVSGAEEALLDEASGFQR